LFFCGSSFEKRELSPAWVSLRKDG
jgi:hypothetical protein